MNRAEVVAAPVAAHGEGPVWDAFHRRLFWVDMMGRQLHALDPRSGAVDSRSFPDLVCAVAPTGSSRLQVAFAKELAWVDWPSGAVTPISPVEPDLPGNRCNDGKRDPAGRFWIGTMSRGGDVVGAGSLYRLDDDGRLRRVLSGLTIANGLGWSPDQRTMYFIDSPTREVWAFDFRLADSAISNRRTVIQVPESLGWPDGMTVAPDGSLWVAHWGAGCVAHWDTLTGRLLGTVETGCPQTSSCAFGGAESRDLFITTSQLGLSPEDLASSPLSGSLVRFALPN
jgi:sugar lactone lactonase YvrE